MAGDIPASTSATGTVFAFPETVRRVVLTGFMGAGKTTSGSLAAELLGWRFFDADQVLEANLRVTIAEIFSTHGEAHFRALEHNNIAALLQQEDAIIALGGGSLEHPGTRHLLATTPDTLVLFLDVPFESVALRCGGQGPVRPVFQDKARLEARYQARLPFYHACHFRIPTGDLSPAEVALRIAEATHPGLKDSNA